MLHKAKGLPPHPVWDAYLDEETKFLKNVRKVPVIKVPKNSNIIFSHTIYKFKANDDASLKLKARIAPHRNTDRDKFLHKTSMSANRYQNPVFYCFYYDLAYYENRFHECFFTNWLS